jgi:hypothetical protein
LERKKNSFTLRIRSTDLNAHLLTHGHPKIARRDRPRVNSTAATMISGARLYTRDTFGLIDETPNMQDGKAFANYWQPYLVADTDKEGVKEVDRK